MDSSWKYITVNDTERTISLHDNIITEWESGDGCITLIFDRGFDVGDDNENNRTGRHLHTGRSAIILRGGEFRGAEKPRHQIIVPGKPVEDIPAHPVENCEYYNTSWFMVMSYEYKPENGMFHISGLDCRNYGDINLAFKCSEIVFLWNGYNGNAWFEGEHRRWAASQVFERHGFVQRFIRYKNTKFPDYEGMPEYHNKYPIYIRPEGGTVYKMSLDDKGISFFISAAQDMAAAAEDEYEVITRFDDSLNADALAAEVEKWLNDNNL